MRPTLVWLACALAIGCADTLGPWSNLNGTWNALGVDTGIALELAQRGTTVSGTGTWWNAVGRTSGTLGVSGTTVGPDVELTLSYETGMTARFTAVLKDANHMRGLETFSSGGSDSLFFLRR